MTRLISFIWWHLGRWLERKGMQSPAEMCIRHAGLGEGAKAEEAMLLLGGRLLARGEFSAAINFYQEILRLHPGKAKAWCGLGAAQRHSLQMEKALSSYRRALELDPDYLSALTNLGEWWLVKGEVGKALEFFEDVLAREPNFYEALANRVVALFEDDRVQEAEEAALEAIALYPDSAPLQVNLGNVLVHTGRGRPGLLAYRRALELQPDNEDALYNLAILQHDIRLLPNAMEYMERQIALKGETAPRLVMLATAMKAKTRLADAEELCRKVIAKHPDHVSAIVLLASCVSDRGDSAEAVECFSKAVAVRPEMAAIYSNILYESNYLSDLTVEQVFGRHKDWASRYELSVFRDRYQHSQSSQRERRLRIGYVSGDFCNHPVGALFKGVVQNHDKEKFEIHCYSNYLVADRVTEEIRAHTNHWHDIALMDVEEVAALIHSHEIDILIDLSGHTAFNRLPALALKPSPIQATWIGYFHSTGLESIDYYISDPHTSPRGSGQLFSETLVHLPQTRWCYSPPDYVPEIAPMPALETKGITFGSFNRLSKLTDPVIEAWASIVKGTPDSRIMIKTRGIDDASVAERVLGKFSDCALPADRIVLRPSGGHRQMFLEYGEIDIALDTFPFNGGLTTLEALWMGVPVVTVEGNSVVSRQTTSALRNVGLCELAFPDVATFIAGAIGLATDLDRLAELRKGLRPRMAASPLRQPEQFTRDLEALYRRMWHAWCEGRRLPSDLIAT
jgi:predicted O-linked N-acetylglucosamine transferase (SPINDLY family)